jgi:tRNA threonylcarbamoyladenosine biosynthesis protein TsaB
MVLRINTADKKTIEVSIKKEDKVIAALKDDNAFGSQVLLSLIKKLITKKNLRFEDLNAIEVEKGPGSYTGLKVGAAVANALAYSLNIPVNGKDMELDLKYERKPSFTNDGKPSPAKN